MSEGRRYWLIVWSGYGKTGGMERGNLTANFATMNRAALDWITAHEEEERRAAGYGQPKIVIEGVFPLEEWADE